MRRDLKKARLAISSLIEIELKERVSAIRVIFVCSPTEFPVILSFKRLAPGAKHPALIDLYFFSGIVCWYVKNKITKNRA